MGIYSKEILLCLFIKPPEIVKRRKRKSYAVEHFPDLRYDAIIAFSSMEMKKHL